MAERKMKLRTRDSEGATEILALITHPMETGQRTDKQTKQKIPAHFIQRVSVELNGKPIATVAVGPAVSEDPLLGFKIKGAKAGDKIKVSWTDNLGESGSAETMVGG